MHTVDIKIFCIAQTRMNTAEVRQWLDHVGATEYPVPRVSQDDTDLCLECRGSGFSDFETNSSCPVCKGTGHPQAEVTDAGAVCGLCAKRCYMSFEPGLNPNVTRVRKDWYKFLTNILASGHGSVLSHASWTFAIEGVSRVFTGEMNRHAVGTAISEGSMRYIRFDDIGFWMPRSLAKDSMMLMPTIRCKACKGKGQVEDHTYDMMTCLDCKGAGRIDLMGQAEFEAIKRRTRDAFLNAFADMEDTYKALCKLWGISTMKSFDTKKKLTSLFRRLIGMGVATGGTWTFNTRALRHIIALRSSEHAEEEISWVAGELGQFMYGSEPALFGDFKRDEKTGAWVPEHVKV